MAVVVETVARPDILRGGSTVDNSSARYGYPNRVRTWVEKAPGLKWSRDNEATTAAPRTHSVLVGGKCANYAIPDKHMSTFYRLYAQSLSMREPHFLHEEHATPAFPFFIDLDIKLTKRVSEDRLLEWAKAIQNWVVKWIRPNDNIPFQREKRGICIIATTPCTAVENGIKAGLHLHFPNMLVTIKHACTIRFYVLDMLNKNGDVDEDGEVDNRPDEFVHKWSKVIDSQVYGHGLRLIGSRKAVKCTCGAEKKEPDQPLRPPYCSKCHGTGRADVGRIYWPRWIIGDNLITGRIQELGLALRIESVTCHDILERVVKIVRLCSVRRLQDEDGNEAPRLQTDWYRQPYGWSEKKSAAAKSSARATISTSSSSSSSASASSSSRDYQSLNRTDEIYKLIVRALAGCDPNYRAKVTGVSLRSTSISTSRSRSRAQPKRYYAFTSSRTCRNLKSGAEHSTKTVYYEIESNGVRQRCTCKCDTTEGRLNGTCSEYRSGPFTVPFLARIFPDQTRQVSSYVTRRMQDSLPKSGQPPTKKSKALAGEWFEMRQTSVDGLIDLCTFGGEQK